MTACRMALLHFYRQRIQSFVIVFSLAIALTGAGLLIHMYILNLNRFQGISQNIQAVVGPKSGGIEILLGSLNLEDRSTGYLPLNLFETLRSGADLRFDDGAIVSSKTFITNVIPVLQYAKFNTFSVFGTDESFLFIQHNSLSAGGRFPQTYEVLLGYDLARIYNLKINDTISLMLNNSTSNKIFKISGILERQNSAWDVGVFTNLESGWLWLTEGGRTHPIWKNKILSFFMLQMKPEGFAPLKSLINDRTVAQLIEVDAEKKKIDELSGSANDLGFMMISVILCLAAFSIFGMMTIRSNQLRVSSATLEAIGYSRFYIFSWMALEGLLVGLSAALLALPLEALAFNFLKGLLNSTWLIPATQMKTPWWSIFILVGGLFFSFIGSMSSVVRLFGINLHQELKSG